MRRLSWRGWRWEAGNHNDNKDNKDNLLQTTDGLLLSFKFCEESQVNLHQNILLGDLLGVDSARIWCKFVQNGWISVCCAQQIAQPSKIQPFDHSD